MVRDNLLWNSPEFRAIDRKRCTREIVKSDTVHQRNGPFSVKGGIVRTPEAYWHDIILSLLAYCNFSDDFNME